MSEGEHVGKNILLGIMPNGALVMIEYDPCQHTVRAAALLMEEHFDTIFMSYVAIHVDEEGRTTRLAVVETTAANTKQAS